MIWTVADFVSRRCGPQKGEGEGGREAEEATVIWDAILRELGGRLAVDSRPEVRNCAVNTLFSCFVGHGSAFPAESWGERVEVVTSLVRAIEDKTSSAGEEDEKEMGENRRTLRHPQQQTAEPGGSKKCAPKVILHHSRDTAQKQWSETRVLVLQGLGRIHRTFFRSLWSEPWYPSLWTCSLQTAYAAVILGARPPNAEVALAGAALLFLLLQLASKTGVVLQGPVRAAVGMKVVDGALQHTAAGRSSNSNSSGGDPSSPERNGAAAAGFEAAKAVMWEEAWRTLGKAVRMYRDDPDGEIAAAVLGHLQTTYLEGEREGGKEGRRACEFESAERTLELIGVVEGLVEARKEGAGGGGAGVDRYMWKPPVLGNQREALQFLKGVRHEEPVVWEAVFAVLTQYALPQQEGGKERGKEGPSITTTSFYSSSSSAAYVRVPTTSQFAKEAADCLIELYDQVHVPASARSVAFEFLVTNMGDACIQCSKTRRKKGGRKCWVAKLERFARREGGLVTYFPVPLAGVKSSGALLRPVLRQGMAAFTSPTTTTTSNKDNNKNNRSSNNSTGSRSSSSRAILRQAWRHAFWVVEGYLIPWNVREEGGEGGGKEGIAWGVLQEEGYTSVGVDLLRMLADEVLLSLEGGLGRGGEGRGGEGRGQGEGGEGRGGRVGWVGELLKEEFVLPAIDLLIDVLFAQAAMAGAIGSPPASSEKHADRTAAAAAVAAEQTPSLIFVKIAFGHLRRLLDALIALIADTQAALPPSNPLPPSLPSSSPSYSASSSRNEVLKAAIQAVRRLVNGVLALSRFVMDRYMCESKSSHPSTYGHLLAEPHLLLLFHFLQSLHVPPWSLPSSLSPLTSSGVTVPGWLEPKRRQGTEKRPKRAASISVSASASAPVSATAVQQQGGREEQSKSLMRRLSSSMMGAGGRAEVKEPVAKEEDEEDEEDEEVEDEDEEDEEVEDEDEEEVLSLLFQPIKKDEDDATAGLRGCGHVFLLANPILSCMGRTSSSVVRAAALELLMKADITGTFWEMRREIRAQQVLLREANGEVVNLREEASRLSVSSVAGFF